MKKNKCLAFVSKPSNGRKKSKMKFDRDYAIFSSGLKISANNGIVGLSPELEVFEGYDGRFGSTFHNEMTPEDECELADYMIKQWGKYKVQAEQRAKAKQ